MPVYGTSDRGIARAWMVGYRSEKGRTSGKQGLSRRNGWERKICENHGHAENAFFDPNDPDSEAIMPMLREIKKKSRSIYVVSNGENGISIRSYQRTFTLLQKSLNIPHRGFHSLRHAFATRALECGMDVKTLSELLGHKSPTVTLNRYAHSLPEHKKEMMNKLGRLI